MNPEPTEEAGAGQLRARRRFRELFSFSYVPSHLADTKEAGEAQLHARRRFRAWFPLSYVPSYLADAVILALFAATGAVAAWVPVAYFAVGCMSGGVFYALLRSGFSERYSDKFMALPQVCVASATVFVFISCAPSVGIVFFGTLFIVSAFGSLRFSWRQTGIMCAIAVFASSGLLYTLGDVSLAPYSSPAQKFIVWIWFALTLPRLMALGLLGRMWRVRSFEQQKKLELALARLAESITEKEASEAERVRLEANRQLQKAESLGRMAAAIAHLFNNHLTVVIGNLELVMMHLSEDSAIRGNMIKAMQAVLRCSETSGLMLTYLGQTMDKGEPLDLSEVCRQSLSMLRAAMPEHIALETDLLSSGPVVRAHPKNMQQVLNHLITNGWESMGHSAGKVTLATRIIKDSEIPESHLAPTSWKPTEVVFSCLEVTDTGCGIAEEDLEKIFDPFFTTKFTGRGLGLAVVVGLVKSWGGAIGVESAKEQGSTFRVFLPLVTGELSPASEKATEAHLMERGSTLLLVEDQDAVREMAESMLKALGYQVLATSGGAEAVKLLQANPDQVCCVITDLSMPGMDGWETLTALRKIRPNIPVVLASGYDEAHAMGRDYPEQPHVFLHKPYLKSELEAAICTALKKQAIAPDNKPRSIESPPASS